MVICINSAPPSTAYMHQWFWSALVQIMACRLFGAKPLSKPMLGYCQLAIRSSVKCYSNSNSFIRESASENIVCKMAAILSRGSWVKHQSAVNPTSTGPLMYNTPTWFPSCMMMYVIKWKHFPCCWPFVRGIQQSPVNSAHKGQCHGALMFSLICSWINGCVNNREPGDLRSHRTHYDITVMVCRCLSS